MEKLIIAIGSIFFISALGLAATWVYSVPLEWMWNTYLQAITGVKVTTQVVFGAILVLSMVHVIVFYKADLESSSSLSEVVTEVVVKVVIKVIGLYVPWGILYVIS